MPVHPQVQEYLDEMAALGAPPASQIPVAVQRDGMRARRVMAVTNTSLAGAEGSIPARVYTPAGPRPLPVLVYFHGGGYVVGDLDVSDLRCRILSEWAMCLVVSVDYRMAPEHPFPAAVEDGYAATRWVAQNAARLGGDPGRLAVGGDSAGGNLAAVVALMARDRGGPSLAFQYLVYPVTDWSGEQASYKQNGFGYGLNADTMAWYTEQYLPNPADRTNPLAAPLRAINLTGLPPAMVITAEYDPLRDEGEAYAARLKQAGVPVELKRYDGMIHGFLSNAGDFDGGKQATIDSIHALRAAFARPRVPA